MYNYNNSKLKIAKRRNVRTNLNKILESSFIAENKMETILRLITNVSVIFFRRY